MTHLELVRRSCVALAALAAVLALAACGGAGDGTADPGTQPAPAVPVPAPAPEPEPEEPEPAEPEEPDAASATIRIVGGEPAGGIERVKIASGQQVRLRVESDAPGDVHVHGYELEQDVGPGSPAVFRFTADVEGVWNVELHPETVIAKLEVSP